MLSNIIWLKFALFAKIQEIELHYSDYMLNLTLFPNISLIFSLDEFDIAKPLINRKLKRFILNISVPNSATTLRLENLDSTSNFTVNFT